tara:strand:+ start:16376 stop:16651 length:276 start_codon:yes stop_codon:yes gene_type:complete
MRCLSFLFCFGILIVTQTAAQIAPQKAVTEVDLQLVLAVDVSGSVDEQEALLQRNGYIAAINDPAVLKAITSGILGRIAVRDFGPYRGHLF